MIVTTQVHFTSVMGVILCDTFSYAKKAFKCKLGFGIAAK